VPKIDALLKMSRNAAGKGRNLLLFVLLSLILSYVSCQLYFNTHTIFPLLSAFLIWWVSCIGVLYRHQGKRKQSDGFSQIVAFFLVFVEATIFAATVFIFATGIFFKPVEFPLQFRNFISLQRARPTQLLLVPERGQEHPTLYFLPVPLESRKQTDNGLFDDDPFKKKEKDKDLLGGTKETDWEIWTIVMPFEASRREMPEWEQVGSCRTEGDEKVSTALFSSKGRLIVRASFSGETERPPIFFVKEEDQWREGESANTFLLHLSSLHGRLWPFGVGTVDRFGLLAYVIQSARFYLFAIPFIFLVTLGGVGTGIITSFWRHLPSFGKQLFVRLIEMLGVDLLNNIPRIVLLLYAYDLVYGEQQVSWSTHSLFLFGLVLTYFPHAYQYSKRATLEYLGRDVYKASISIGLSQRQIAEKHIFWKACFPFIPSLMAYIAGSVLLWETSLTYLAAIGQTKQSAIYQSFGEMLGKLLPEFATYLYTGETHNVLVFIVPILAVVFSIYACYRLSGIAKAMVANR
jgi:ABC-type amino acid transport system permease subunit